MNADPTDTRNPHLDLEDLIAGAAGQPLGDRAQRHLAGCAQCLREANRWSLVAEGVRGLTAAAPETAATPQTAQPAGPRHTRGRVLTGPWRRTLLVAGSAAAALIVLVGAGVLSGDVHIHLSGPGGNGTQASLTAVTGCSQLQQAEGTLAQVTGTSLVIREDSGRQVTVTTTPTTFMSMSGELTRDITDGTSVTVRGFSSDGTIQAAIVTIGKPLSGANPPVFTSVHGTVADASAAGFTVVTSSGTRIPVTTSASTFVDIPRANPGQLQVGAAIWAVGNAGPNGTLSATGVAGVTQLPPGLHVHTGVKVKDCSPGSIDEALGAISSSHASVG